MCPRPQDLQVPMLCWPVGPQNPTDIKKLHQNQTRCRSPIHASQQLASPTVSYPWTFHHRLVRHCWYYRMAHDMRIVKRWTNRKPLVMPSAKCNFDAKTWRTCHLLWVPSSIIPTLCCYRFVCCPPSGTFMTCELHVTFNIRKNGQKTWMSMFGQ